MTSLTSTNKPTSHELRDYFEERMDMLEVRPVYNHERGGWDVMLRLDGTYFSGIENIQGMTDFAEYTRELLIELMQLDGIEVKSNLKPKKYIEASDGHGYMVDISVTRADVDRFLTENADNP